MAIGSIVKYDAVSKLELLHPVTGDETGVILDLTSNASAGTKAVVRKQIDQQYDMRARNQALKASIAEKSIMERLASCVKGWDFNGEEIFEGEGEPEFNQENVMRLLSIDWVYEQVNAHVNNIANFTKG